MSITASPLDGAPAPAAEGSSAPAPAPTATAPSDPTDRAHGGRRSSRAVVGLLFASAVLFVLLVVTPLVVISRSPGDIDIDTIAVSDRPVPAVADEPANAQPVVAAPVESDDEPSDEAPEDNGVIADVPVLEEEVLSDPTEGTLNELLGLGTIGFESGSDEPTTAAKLGLREVATYLKNNPQRILVTAHTDSLGSDATNRRLSQERAELVRDRLIGMGVDETLLFAVGIGEDQPIASNDTEAGRDENRRIEFVRLEGISFGGEADTDDPDTVDSDTVDSDTVDSDTVDSDTDDPDTATGLDAVGDLDA